MSANQYCDQCGKSVASGARFCGGCGTSVGPSELPVQLPSSNSNKGIALAVVGGSVAGLIAVALLAFVLWPRLSGGDKVAAVATPTAASSQGVAAVQSLAASPAAVPAKVAAPTATPRAAGAPTTAVVAMLPSPTTAPATSTPAPTATQPRATPTLPRATPPPTAPFPGAGANRGNSPDLTSPASYLLRPGTQLNLFEIFPSGEEAEVELIAAKIADPVQVTVLRVVLADGEVMAQFTEHFVARQDGIYVVTDDDPSMSYKWLGNNLKKGSRWEKDGIVSTVADAGVRVDLGFMVAENCLVVEHNNTEVEFRETVFYAPGLGAVMVKSPGGEVTRKLNSVKSLGEKQAADILRPLSPNVGSIKP